MPSTPTATVAYKAPSDMMKILNYIRQEASLDYQSRIPQATKDNIREIGSALLNYTPSKNEFLDALINRIGMVIISNRLYNNPLRRFKKGTLEYGESVEEIFVNLVKAKTFDQSRAEQEVFKREIPNVDAVFHKLNRQDYYKITVSDFDLRQAFLSYAGVSDLITRLIESVYTSNNFDEFVLMKQLIVEWANEGNFYAVQVPQVTADSAKSFVSTIKGYSNLFEFMSGAYNPMGVPTYSDKSRQVLIIDARIDALIDVEVLASAFNMNKAEFMGMRVTIDNFAELTGAVAALVDEDFFMVFDNLLQMESIRNPEGLYWNYNLHVWQILSVSPYANAVLFTTDEVEVESVTVEPSTITLNKGSRYQFKANVTATGGASKAVGWSIQGQAKEGTSITPEGILIVASDEPTSTKITVTATSVTTGGVAGTATVTVA